MSAPLTGQTESASQPVTTVEEALLQIHPAHRSIVELEISRLSAALELIWAIHVRKHTHLGYERYSGVEQHCIPCICAMALHQGMGHDCFDGQEFVNELEKLKTPDAHSSEVPK